MNKSMKKKYKAIVIILITIIAFSNVFSGLVNTIVFGIGYSYTYETNDGKYKFSFVPSKGGSLEVLLSKFNELQKDNPDYTNTSLSRTFKQKPLQFWNWYSYFFSERYSFPYKETSGSSINYKGLDKK